MSASFKPAALTPGDAVPSFSLLDQDGNVVRPEDFAGSKLFIFFYPRANTGGCTAQAVAVQEILPQLNALGVKVLGISPDSPTAQKRFAEKHGLRFPLLSDADHMVAEAFGVWGEKQVRGKSVQGIVRSGFLFDAAGILQKAWSPVSPKDTVPKLMEALKAAP
ncbi:MAG: thioredoxin-dependent thiol peroxidase [Desulfosoma sp.]|uniref:thioredoxin-dependent thiol peroxidase n=1 Tax=Desulfosoma sp. TaxID=2603217 RepID=UPI004049C039